MFLHPGGARNAKAIDRLRSGVAESRPLQIPSARFVGLDHRRCRMKKILVLALLSTAA
jgi:hypothetical protein